MALGNPKGDTTKASVLRIRLTPPKSVQTLASNYFKKIAILLHKLALIRLIFSTDFKVRIQINPKNIAFHNKNYEILRYFNFADEESYYFYLKMISDPYFIELKPYLNAVGLTAYINEFAFDESVIWQKVEKP